jgi:hypothetical protein
VVAGTARRVQALAPGLRVIGALAALATLAAAAAARAGPLPWPDLAATRGAAPVRGLKSEA